MSEASPDPPKPSKRKWDQPAPGEDATAPAKVAKIEESKSASEAAAAAAAIAAKIAAQFANGTLGGDGSKDQHDAEFTHDIDINDVRNRYLLTRGSTQDQVRASTSCLLMVAGYSWLSLSDSRGNWRICWDEGCVVSGPIEGDRERSSSVHPHIGANEGNVG